MEGLHGTGTGTWRTFRTDLRPGKNDGKTLNTLLHPNSGILPLVHRVALTPSFDGGNYTADVNATDVLKLLIMGLPVDALEHFNSSLYIDSLTLGLLLQRHQKLKRLCTPLKMDEGHKAVKLAEANWMAPYLTELRYLRVYIGSSHDSTDIGFLIDDAPKLTELQILGYRNQGLIQAQSKGHCRSADLCNLTVVLVDIDSNSKALSARIDAMRLKTIVLIHCENITSFLRGLAARFCDDTTIDVFPVLKKLEVKLEPSDWPAGISALENLLQSFLGLQHLLLDHGGLWLVDKKSIIRHHTSLKYLRMNYTDREVKEYYSPGDTLEIMTSCTELKTLAITLPPVKLGHVSELGRHFSLQAPAGSYAKSKIQVILVSTSLAISNLLSNNGLGSHCVSSKPTHLAYTNNAARGERHAWRATLTHPPNHRKRNLLS